MKALFFFFCMIIIPSIALAGPFGTNMGDSIDLYLSRNNTFTSHGLVKTKYPPVKHPDFSSYSLYFGNKRLYRIVAISDPLDHRTGPRDLLPKYQSLKDKLCRKYGNPTMSSEYSWDWYKLIHNPLGFWEYMSSGRKHECEWLNLNGDIVEVKLSITDEGGDYQLNIEYYYSNSGRGQNSTIVSSDSL